MTVWFATSNNHKAAELQAILGSGVTVKTPAGAGLDFEPEETGATFLDNALIKARALLALAGAPVIADDSGLCVDALDGRPGIYSARYRGRFSDRDCGRYRGRFSDRYSGKLLESAERNALLLAEMEGRTNRAARFVCAMALLFDGNRFFTAQETLEGEIIRTERGSGGFGYDPILYLPERGLTVAELGEAEKNRVSHRGKAARAIALHLAAAE
jgi:XTP/dITP diphosphohydrolase